MRGNIKQLSLLFFSVPKGISKLSHSVLTMFQSCFLDFGFVQKMLVGEDCLQRLRCIYHVIIM